MAGKITPQDICFVVVSYKRPWNIPVIVQSAERYGFGEVYIWDNSEKPEELEKWLVDEAPEVATTYRIGRADYNCYTMGRYAGTIRACEKDIVATCDDDYLLTQAGWDRLIENWDGRKIVSQLPRENNQYESARSLPYLNLGYGSLFDKDWAREAFAAIESVTNGTQNDILVRKADRCFTSYHQRRIVLEAEFGTHLIKLRNPDGCLSETDRHSIHLTREHLMDSHRAISLGLQAQEAAVGL